MPDPTLPLPTEPIPHGQQPVSPPVDPYEDATFAGYEPPLAPAPLALPAAPPPAPTPAPAPGPRPAPLIATPAPPPPIISRIGEISVSATTVYTPTGELPLRHSQWIVTEQWQARTKIPTWAIVMCVFTFFCFPFLNFLFLLAKETYYTGAALVSVSNAGRHYVARVPVANQSQLQALQHQVNYVRSLAAL